MAEITIKFNLPDGQEQALIEEFATFHGWTGEGTAAAYAKKVVSEVIRESIKNSRQQKARKSALEAITVPEII